MPARQPFCFTPPASASNRYFYEFSDGQVYMLKDYTLLDAGLFYDLGSWTAQLNFNNLLDERHFPVGAGLDRITPGEPRNWHLTLSKSFF
jgi:iron complex outermembrane receptor protein